MNESSLIKHLEGMRQDSKFKV